MPFLPKARRVLSEDQAKFVCRLNFVDVHGNLGRGERLSETFFVTNDSKTITDIVGPKFRESMGSLEYNSLLKSQLLAYGVIDNVADGTENQKLIETLFILDAFENTLWLRSDNCFGHETAFLLKENRIWSNIYEGRRSLADGTYHQTLDMSANGFRDVVRLFRDSFLPNPTVVAQFHTKANSTRISRTMSHISRAQKTAFLSEKITFYCSALEALLSTSQAELSHQIAERAALITSENLDERVETYGLVKNGYSYRSKYIHGSVLKDSVEKIQAMARKLDGIVRKCLMTAINDSMLSAAIKNVAALDDYVLRKIFEGPLAREDRLPLNRKDGTKE
jgi:hypothetical protein